MSLKLNKTFMVYNLSLMTCRSEEEVTWKGELNECGESKGKGVRRVLGQGNKKLVPLPILKNHVLGILKYVGGHLRPSDTY